MSKRYILVMSVMVTHLLGCATVPPPEPAVLEQVQASIQRAVDAGAEQHASVELRFAMERLDFARNVAIPEEDYELAGWRLREAQLNAELAYVKTQSELARADEDAVAREVEQLQRNLRTEFGENR